MKNNLLTTDKTWIILSYFLEYPKKETYSRELERILKISSSSTSTICKRLEKWNVLKSQKKANLHLYKLNNSNVFVKSLKTSWFLEWLMNYKQIIENPEFQSVVLYGSYANGEFYEKSDVDILVITNIDKKQVKDFFKEMQDNFSAQFSLTVFTLAQWKNLIEKNDRFYKEVLANHILIYGAPILLG